MRLYVNADKKIFTVYVGLISSGYDLYREECPKEILKIIESINFNDKVKNYFKCSRTETCKVNPYWPRAFLLTLASMYICDGGTYEYKHFKDVVNHLNELDNISSEELGEQTVKWLEGLPEILTVINENEKFKSLWKLYLEQVEKENEKYKDIILQAVISIKKLMNVCEDELPVIEFIPNWLQAPEATDIININSKIYIVKTEPDKESVIHEVLHYLLDDKFKKCDKEVVSHLNLLKPVLKDMIKYQYAWAYNEESWKNVFEENFMRAMSIWINNYENKTNALLQAELYGNQGFLYVPIILNQLYEEWTRLNDFEGFLSKSLEICALRIVRDKYE